TASAMTSPSPSTTSDPPPGWGTAARNGRESGSFAGFRGEHAQHERDASVDGILGRTAFQRNGVGEASHLSDLGRVDPVLDQLAPSGIGALGRKLPIPV